MRPLGWLILAVTTQHVFAQGPPSAAPKTIEECVREELSCLRSFSALAPTSKGIATEAFVLYTRAVCGDLTKADRVTLSVWYDEWKLDERHEAFETPLDLATVILALTAGNADPRSKAHGPSENPNRPPRGSRFDKDQWKLLNECVVRLLKGPQGQDGTGSWGLGADLATTHFALLSLREASRAGYPVDPKCFERALSFLRRFADGRYSRTQPTCEELARIMVCAWICRERLAVADPKHPALDSSRGLVEKVALLEPVFRSEQPPTIACLWTMEQLGSMTGQAELGGRNWYREGTNRLLATEKWYADGSDQSVAMWARCYGLLFLKRQTAPLAAGK